MVETTWRWVTEPKHGDPDDCNNVLVERTRNDAMGMTSTVDSVILRCGNIDAEHRDLIGAAKDMQAMLVRIKAYFGDLENWQGGLLGERSDRLYTDVQDVLAAARGEGVPDGQ